MIEIANFVSNSSILMKEFVITLVGNDKKRCKAENIEIEGSGALSGVVYDRDHTDPEGMMGTDIIWSFAPGTWLYVERNFEAES